MGKAKLMVSPMRAIHEAIISLKPISQYYTCIPYSACKQRRAVGESEDEEEEIIKKPLISNRRRLFFSPSMTNSIMEEARTRTAAVSCGDSAVVVVASADPYADFRASMEEMVEAHGMRRWEPLLELLQCYLRLNEEKDHSAIAMAFVDLVATLPLVLASDHHH